MTRWRRAEIIEAAANTHFREVLADDERARAVALAFGPGETVPEHMHPRSAEIYVVLSGTALVTIEGERFDAEPGDVLLIAAAQRHAIAVPDSTDEAFVILAFVAPNLYDAVFSVDALPPHDAGE